MILSLPICHNKPLSCVPSRTTFVLNIDKVPKVSYVRFLWRVNHKFSFLWQTIWDSLPVGWRFCHLKIGSLAQEYFFFFFFFILLHCSHLFIFFFLSFALQPSFHFLFKCHFQINPLEYEVTMTIPELVELVLKNHSFTSSSRGTELKNDGKESAERSTGEWLTLRTWMLYTLHIVKPQKESIAYFKNYDLRWKDHHGVMWKLTKRLEGTISLVQIRTNGFFHYHNP